MTITIKDGERGVLTRDGCFLKLLTPGRHSGDDDCEVEVVKATPGERYNSLHPVEPLLGDPEASKQLTTVDVAPNELVFVSHYGAARLALSTGHYVLWTLGRDLDVERVDITDPLVDEETLLRLTPALAKSLLNWESVAEYEQGLLFVNGVLAKTLDPGRYALWANSLADYEVKTVDLRLQQLDVSGQELLTADKVTVRLNVVCTFKVTDTLRAATGFSNHAEQLRTLVQLALRRAVCALTLDELLASREDVAEGILYELKTREAEYAVTFTDSGVKDVILPGEIRDIMNSVLLAEKRAQANVIVRRDEAASMRNKLNSARLLEENPTLMRLTELESIERICEHVGSLSVGGSENLLGELAKLAGKS